MSMGGPDHKYTEEAKAVSFFGATELRNVNGPIKVAVPYRSGGASSAINASAFMPTSSTLGLCTSFSIR